MKKSRSSGSYFARSVVVGLVILAAAAIIIAWMDQAGFDEQIIRTLNKVRY